MNIVSFFKVSIKFLVMLLDFNFKEFVWSLHSQPSSLQIEQKFQLSDANNSS